MSTPVIHLTDTQGQYLAFINAYTKVNRRPPAETDIARFFDVSPPSVHRMIVELERKGFLAREQGKARSLRVLLAPEQLPLLR
jgi:Mn-dependent DtxR family transcriptional regulator